MSNSWLHKKGDWDFNKTNLNYTIDQSNNSYSFQISDNNAEPIMTISPKGEVVWHQTGADVAAALAEARRAWHDPASSAARDIPGAGAVKRALLARIDGEPRGSAARRAAFLSMHERLGELRAEHAGVVEAARQRAAAALREAAAAPIADRRTWPFALYADEMIDELAEAVGAAVGGPGWPQSRVFDRPRSP